MIGVISLKGILELTNVYGAVDGLTFEAFVVNKLLPKLWRGACVVMDNAKIHLGETIRKEIEKVGALISLFTTLFATIFHQSKIVGQR